MIGLIALGFALSLDNFRTALALGAMKPKFRQSATTSLIFGMWDGLAVLAGILAGSYVSSKISEPAEWIALIGVATYGVWVIIKAIRSPETVDPDLKTARMWLPVPLSVDNLAAGATLGLAGVSLWLAPVVFGAVTFLMALVGHQAGRTVANLIPRMRTDILTGIAFVAMAGLALVGVGEL